MYTRVQHFTRDIDPLPNDTICEKRIRTHFSTRVYQCLRLNNLSKYCIIITNILRTPVYGLDVTFVVIFCFVKPFVFCFVGHKSRDTADRYRRSTYTRKMYTYNVIYNIVQSVYACVPSQLPATPAVHDINRLFSSNYIYECNDDVRAPVRPARKV